MKISFADFWTPFDYNNNFFTHLLRSSREDIVVTHPSEADVLFFGPFGHSHMQYNCKKVFFTGENVRPNYDHCDYSISFDFDSYDGRNVRIPLWYLFIDWFGVKTYDNPNWLVPVEYLTSESEFTQKEKNKFCCTVFSSNYDIRYKMISALNEYKSMDCYGKQPGFNQVPEGEKQKLDVVSDYKFSLCLENSIYPGYYTEKLLHAKVAGTIPIYGSDLSFERDFNKNCCINVLNYDIIGSCIEDIKRIDSDDSIYKSMLNEPLFNKVPDLNDIANQLTKIL